MFRQFILLLTALSLSACTGKQDSPGAAGSEKKSADRVVNLFIWSNFISGETLKEFEQATGIRVQISNYSSNEELLAKLQAGAAGYDVVVPSDYMVSAMIKQGLLKEIEPESTQNRKNVDPFVLNKHYDPGNRYSLPYAWGTTGIAVNRELYKDEVTSWKDLLENPKLAGKFSLLDDAREVTGAVLKMKGKSLNSVSDSELTEAKSVLVDVKKRVRTFTSEPISAITNGEVAAAQMFSSDALQAAKQSGGKVAFILPSEGSTLTIDSLAIPKNAPHPKEAHEFINFLMRPEANAALVKERFSGPVLKATFELLPKEMQVNSGIFPDKVRLAKCEMINDLGEKTALYDRLWTEVKAAQ